MLTVNVYRCRSDATNDPSSTLNKITVINADGPDEVKPDAPAYALHKTRRGILRLVPCRQLEDGSWTLKEGWFMMSGNFAYTSDSRFLKACRWVLSADFYGAVAIHDHKE